MTEVKDVLIRLFMTMNASQMKATLKEMQAMTQGTSSSFDKFLSPKKIDKTMKNLSKAMQPDFLRDFMKETKQFGAGMGVKEPVSKLMDNISPVKKLKTGEAMPEIRLQGKLIEPSNEQIKKIVDAVDQSALKEVIQKTEDEMNAASGSMITGARKTARVWIGAFMSIMWFSFTVKARIMGFLNGAISSFLKLTEANVLFGKSINPVNRAITAVSASWEYFKYVFVNTVIGPLLLPLIPILMDIVDKVTEWMNTNPELMKWIGIILAIIIVMTTLGFWVSQVGLLITTVFGSGALTSMSAFGYTISLTLGALASWILLIIAIVAILYLAWKNNFGGIQQTVQRLWDYIQKFVSNLGDMFNHLFKAIDDLMNGNAEAFQADMEGLTKAAARAFLDILGAALALGTGLINIFAAITGAIASVLVIGIENAFNQVIDLVNGMFGVIQKALDALPKEVKDTLWGGAYAMPNIGHFDTTKSVKAVTGTVADVTAGTKVINEAYANGMKIITDQYLTDTDATTKAIQKTDDATNSLGATLQAQANCVSRTAEATNIFNTATLNHSVSTQTATTSTQYMTQALVDAKKAQDEYAASLQATITPVTKGNINTGTLMGPPGPGETKYTSALGSILYSTQPQNPATWTPSMQSGGLVTQTGLMYLHAGEKVTPKDEVNNSPINITINGPVVKDETDIHNLADKIGAVVRAQISRRQKLIAG